MTSFRVDASGGPASVLVLLAGMVGVMALYGLGRTLLAIVRLRLPFVWKPHSPW